MLPKSHRIAPTLAAALVLWLGLSCAQFPLLEEMFGEEPVPTVQLTYNRIVYRCSVLVDDMKLPVEILPPAPIPYSDQAFAGIRVGYNFPYEDFKEIMTWARHYYKDAHYIMLTNPDARDVPRQRHYKLHLGVRTDEAFKEGWKPWKESDFSRIKSIGSQEEMRTLLQSFKGEPNPLPYQSEEKPWWRLGF